MAPDDSDLQDPFANNELDELDDSDFEEESQKSRFDRRYLLIGLVVAALLCLVGLVIFRVFTEGGDEVAVNTPTPIPALTEEPTVVATVADEPTPSPTRVIAEEPTEEPTTEVTAEPTPTEPTPTAVPPTPAGSPTTGAADMTISVGVVEGGPPENQLKNGGFEEGFDEQGVALDWASFSNGSAIVSYSTEITGPQVMSGSSAQRISIAEATQPDRYAGIYQQMEVAPNQPYTLTLHGQIRTGPGDTQASSYGYRLQYALDFNGGDNWRNVPAEGWVELPWDEQPLGSPDVKFLPYTTVITPTAEELTLFVRAWNKWADPGLAEYTLDDLSLVGAASAPVLIVSGEGPDDGDALIPVTGDDGPTSLFSDGRFWGAMLILLLLATGAIYRGRWGY